MSLCLVDYGIQNEKSDFRVHVCVQARQVWFYPTSCGVLSMYSCPLGKCRNRDGQVTGVGHLVPPRTISHAHLLKTDPSWFGVFSQNQFEEKESFKGSKAVELVKNIIYKGWFPFSVKGWDNVEDPTEQIAGADLLVLGDRRIQIKCDWRGGDKPHGTGNLFLQTKEINLEGHH